MKKLFGAVEIGGTKQQLAVIDETGRILDLVCGKFSLPNGAIDVFNWIEANFPVLLGKYEVCAIGVGYGGVYMGNTLSAIAAQNGLTLAQLTALNPQIPNPNLILVGQTIYLN